MEMPDVVLCFPDYDTSGGWLVYKDNSETGNGAKYHHTRIVEALKSKLSETVIHLAARNSEIAELKAKLDKKPTMFDIYSLVENAHEAINEGEIEEAKSILSALKNSLEPFSVMKTVNQENIHPSIRHESWKHGDPRFDPNARG